MTKTTKLDKTTKPEKKIEVDAKDFNELLGFAKDYCEYLAEQDYHGNTDCAGEQADLFALVKKYDSDYLDPADEYDEESTEKDNDESEEEID